MKKIYPTILFCTLAMILAVLLSGCGAPDDAVRTAAMTADEPVIETAEPTPTAAPPGMLACPAAGHPALLRTDDSGMFYPNRAVSRVSLCRVLYPMLDGLPAPGRTVFSDLKAWDDGYTAAASLCAAGVMEADDGAFHPRNLVTRGEASDILRTLSGRLSGQAAERAAALADDVAAGLSGPEGSSLKLVTLSELAVIVERLAGREPDTTALLLGDYLPADVTPSNYAWAYIADAVTKGEIPKAEPGVHRAWDSLYAVWDDGTLVTDMDYGVWTFGLDGRYTTGNEELDGYIAEALEKSGANDLEGEEALAAAYLYIRHSFEYLVRPEDMTVEDVGIFGWEYERARRFFQYGGGTCYGFAAAFGVLARALGEEAYIVSAQVNEFYGPHGFVVIPEGDIDWIYDVELENTRPELHADLALFHIRNHQIYHYWYESDWREQ